MVRIKSEAREQAISQMRKTLLNAAAEEFASNGYDQANINTISLKAGFSKGTIYNYFPSKQALLRELIDSIAQEHLEYVQSAVMIVGEPTGKLEHFFRAGFEYVATHSYRARVIFNAINSSDQELKEFCFQEYQPMFQLIAEQILSPGMQQGAFREVELQPTVLLLMTIYLGTASQVDEQGRPWLDSSIVAGFVLRALRPME